MLLFGSRLTPKSTAPKSSWKSFQEAGLPDGVINTITCDGPVAGEVVFKHRDFAGLHFTGSTGVFRHLWKTIGENLETYRSYPRIVGETGGKDFRRRAQKRGCRCRCCGLIRGAFEFQGQNAAPPPRAYMPASLWPASKRRCKMNWPRFKWGRQRILAISSTPSSIAALRQDSRLH